MTSSSGHSGIFYSIGVCTSRNAWFIIFFGYFLALLLTCCIIPFGSVEVKIENLWIKEGGRVHEEFEYIKEYAIPGVGREFILIDTTIAQGEDFGPGEDMLTAGKLIAMGDFLKEKVTTLSTTVKDIDGVEHEVNSVDILDGGNTGAYNRLSVLDCFVGECECVALTHALTHALTLTLTLALALDLSSHLSSWFMVLYHV